jgi:N-dimethylarginine dimethylaminohydrolase
MKKWETREWWESRQWSKEDIEQMEKEEYDRLSKQPWFEHGKPCKTDIFWQRDWREEFEFFWGKWGAEGIGKLRKVALSRPSEYESNPVFSKEPAYYRMYGNVLPELDKWQKTIEEVAKAYEGEGVEVVWIEPPESPLGPYGFMRWFCTLWNTSTKAGMILNRMGRCGAAAEFTNSKWLAQELIKIGCPIYHMMLNAGEITPIYLAENSVIIADGYPTSTEAVEESENLLLGLGNEVWVSHNTGYLDIWGAPAGGTSHLDMVLGVADLGLAIIYPSFIDFNTIRYLRSKKIRMIEVPPDEFTQYGVNIVAIEPGKIVIPAAAKQTIKALRKEGVECIEIDFSDAAKSGLGGPDCITMKLLRDTGPTLDDL